MTALPPRALEVRAGYLRQLQSAGVSSEEIAFAEEFLTPEGGKSEDELILDIRSAWVFVRDVAKRKGAKL